MNTNCVSVLFFKQKSHSNLLALLCTQMKLCMSCNPRACLKIRAELKVDCGGAEQLGGSVSCEKNILSDKSIAHNLLTLCHCNGYPHNLGTDCIACP